MITPLHEQLRDAADACTPSPLQDLLRRAADAVEVKQEPVAWIQSNHLRSITRGDPGLQRMFASVANHKFQSDYVPLFTYPAPIPDGMMRAPVEANDTMVNAGIELAMRVKLSSSYTWPDYVRDIYKAMLKAAGEST